MTQPHSPHPWTYRPAMRPGGGWKILDNEGNPVCELENEADAKTVCWLSEQAGLLASAGLPGLVDEVEELRNELADLDEESADLKDENEELKDEIETLKDERRQAAAAEATP